MPAPASQSKRNKRDFQMPPLPAGYSVDSVPPLPHGYTLDAPVTSDSNVPDTGMEGDVIPGTERSAGYNPHAVAVPGYHLQVPGGPAPFFSHAEGEVSQPGIESRPTAPQTKRTYSGTLPGMPTGEDVSSSVLELKRAQNETQGLTPSNQPTSMFGAAPHDPESYEHFIQRAAQAGQGLAASPNADLGLERVNEANQGRIIPTLAAAPLLGGAGAAGLTALGESLPLTLGKVPGGRGPGGKMLPWGTEKTIGAGIGTAIAGGAKALGKADSIEKLAKFYLYNKLLNRIGLKGAQDIVP